MTDQPRFSWNQAICERDWIDQRATWRKPTFEELALDTNGLDVDSDILVDIPVPVRMIPDHVEIERCAWCGEPTIFGVYIREDPMKVSFPRLKES